jgi:hypothetical protein
MVTNYPQQVARTVAVTLEGTTDMFGRTLGRLGQMFCGLSGHDSMRHFESNRVTMRCVSCGHDTPGWEISERGPRKRFDGNPRHHLLTTEHLTLRKTA